MSGMAMSGTHAPRRLVVCSLERWDEVWRRNQYLVDGLLRMDPDLEVLFVEPAADPLYMLRRAGRAQFGRGLRTVDGYGGRLRALEPTKWIPRRAGRIADRLLQRRLRRTVAGLGWRAPLLWVNDPSWADLLAATAWPALYDITDDWLTAERSPREHARLVAAEHLLLAEAVEVVVCSPGLTATKSPIRPVTLIGNAVDVDRYRTAVPRPTDAPDRPYALYAGTLHTDRLDVDLVLATAAALAAAGASLVLLGPDALDAPDRERLRSAPGVVVLGARAWSAIPGFLQHAHALVVPHVVDEFTDSLDPIKLYEYLAVGRPVVSTPVAGFREHAGDDGVTIADGRDFVTAAVAAARAWSPEVVHADVPDWSARTVAMGDVIQRLTENVS
jgi:teichuronic acid biosynthesis glycosyltransferase TuaH